MSDVIFFDYWTRGTRHFKKISDKLSQSNISSMLLHTASWRGDLDLKRAFLNNYEEYIDNILCRDILHYNNSLIEALKREQPKVVVLLNVQTEDRIIIRYCRINNIKTVYLMHGILDPDTKALSKTMDSAFGFKDRLVRFKKYKILFKEYLLAFNEAGSFGFLNKEYFTYFIKLFISPGKIVFNLWKFEDSYPDIALVYTQSDFDLFIEKMGYSSEKIKIVGNYNLDKVFKKLTIKDSQSLVHNHFSIPISSKYILYIEGGFFTPSYNVPGWTLENIASEVRSICSLINKYNLFLIVKLHPSSDYLNLEEMISDIQNLRVTKDFDISYLNLNALAVFGQSSSVLRIPLLINKPLFILSLDPLKLVFKEYIEKDFGELIDSFSSLEFYVKKLVSNNYVVNLKSSKNIKYHLHPFDGLSSKRICDEILKELK